MMENEPKMSPKMATVNNPKKKKIKPGPSEQRYTCKGFASKLRTSSEKFILKTTSISSYLAAVRIWFVVRDCC